LQKLALTTSGAKAPSKTEGYRSAESAAPPKIEFSKLAGSYKDIFLACSWALLRRG
jgi:hypothetical protein